MRTLPRYFIPIISAERDEMEYLFAPIGEETKAFNAKAQHGRGRPAVKSTDRIGRAMGDTKITLSIIQVCRSLEPIERTRPVPSSTICPLLWKAVSNDWWLWLETLDINTQIRSDAINVANRME